MVLVYGYTASDSALAAYHTSDLTWKLPSRISVMLLPFIGIS